MNNGPLLGYAVALYFLSKVLHKQNLCAMAANLPNSLPTDYNAFNVVPEIIGQSVHKTLLWNPGGDLTPIVSGTKDNNCKALVMVGSEPTFISMMRTATSQGMTDGSITWMGLTTGYTTHAAVRESAANGTRIDREQDARWWAMLQQAGGLAANAVEILTHRSTSSATGRGTRLGRYFRDVTMYRQHISSQQMDFAVRNAALYLGASSAWLW